MRAMHTVHTHDDIGSHCVLEAGKVEFCKPLPSVLRLVTVEPTCLGHNINGRIEGIELTQEKLDRDLMSSFCSGCHNIYF